MSVLWLTLAFCVVVLLVLAGCAATVLFLVPRCPECDLRDRVQNVGVTVPDRWLCRRCRRYWTE